MENSEKIVVFINAIRPATFSALEQYKKQTGMELTPLVLANHSVAEKIYQRNNQNFITKGVKCITIDFNNKSEIMAIIKSIEKNVVAVTAQYENCIHDLAQIIEYFDFLNVPSKLSLELASEKMRMRDILADKAPHLNPSYIEVDQINGNTIEEIERKIDYPMIVKPSGLEGSLLVSVVHNNQELVERLMQVREMINTAYATWVKRNRPMILVESFMQGKMYSIDSYISHDGKYYHCPAVRVFTGYEKGYEDFFGFIQTTPTDIEDIETTKARSAVEQACDALGLRSVTAHVELMQTTEGWKIIEIGPRIGGYRHDLYKNSFGINHILNDIIVRCGEVPVINYSPDRYCAYVKLYPKTEGVLLDIINENLLHDVRSIVNFNQEVKIGETAKFAKHNGDPIFDMVLINEDKNKLWEDILCIQEKISFKVI